MSETEFMLSDGDWKHRSRNQFLLRVLVIGFSLILLFVILNLMLSSNTPTIRRPEFVQNCSTNYNYDFSLLTIRWPQTICLSQKCPTGYVGDQWLIHGLWPTYDNQSWPQYCCYDRKFVPKNLDPIRSELLINWPNLMAGESNDSLWRHEWQKHGTCTKTKQIDYFNTTLNYFQTYPIYEWLKESNITPNNDLKYNSTAFQSVLANKLGHNVVISCSQIEKQNKDFGIKEISFCISHTTNEVIDCPEKISIILNRSDSGLESTNCETDFYYPKQK